MLRNMGGLILSNIGIASNSLLPQLFSTMEFLVHYFGARGV